jgi:hypothetical protein
LGLATDASPDGFGTTITGKSPGSPEATSPPPADEDEGSVLCSGSEVGWLGIVNV